MNAFDREILIAVSKDELKADVKGICGVIPSFKTVCLDFVNNYFDLAYEFIISELDPKTCLTLGVCSANETNQIFSIETLDKIIIPQQSDESEEFHVNTEN